MFSYKVRNFVRWNAQDVQDKNMFLISKDASTPQDIVDNQKTLLGFAQKEIGQQPHLVLGFSDFFDFY